jgi:uncharacterized damage-inducible protein DinB
MLVMKIERNFFEPVSGFPHEIGFYLAGILDIRRQWRNVVDDLTKEELAAKILPEVQPIGTLIIHIAEAEYWWMQCVVEHKEFTDEIRQMMHHDLWFEDFAAKELDVEYCLGVVDKVHQMTLETLSKFSDEDLERFFIRDYQDKKGEFSLRWILHNLYDHEATHKGQILMIKRILRKIEG